MAIALFVLAYSLVRRFELQLIQVQFPPQVSQPSAYTPTVQGDIGTFLVLIVLSVLVKLLSDKP